MKTGKLQTFLTLFSATFVSCKKLLKICESECVEIPKTSEKYLEQNHHVHFLEMANYCTASANLNIAELTRPLALIYQF